MAHKLWRNLPVLAFLAMTGGAADGIRGQQDPWTIATLCTPYPANTRPPIAVSNGVELQNALDDARAGDTILLKPGTTFHPPGGQGSFVLRNKSIPEGQWVIVRSASPAFDMGGKIGPNIRVTPADAELMPKLRATRPVVPVLRAEAGAHGYRLVGLDIGPEQVTQITAMVELGSGLDRSLSLLPHDIVIDRCYIHGNDIGNYRRGVAMNGIRLAVIESHIDNFHDNSDSQAINGYNGPGPFKIVNNYLEAASENVMFGGADPHIDGLVPSDIEIRGNLMTKRLAWRSAGIPVKNAFELKAGRRMVVEGNIFENVWRSGQDGTAIVLKSTNPEGGCPHCATEYVLFRHNIVRHAGNGVVISAAETGRRGAPLPERVNHVRFENVLFEDITTEWGGSAKLLRFFGGASDIVVTHITSTSNANGILDPLAPSDVNPNLVFTYNIVERKRYGIGAGGDEGIPTLARNFTPNTYRDNLIVNTSQGIQQAISDNTLKAKYPPLTFVVSGWDAVRFQSGTYRLAPDSPFRRAGDDGKDLGVDMDALQRAQTVGGSTDCSEGTPRAPERPRQRPPA